MQKPISLSASVLAGRCSSVLTSTLCLSVVTCAGTVAGADAHEIGAAGQQRLLGHPQQMRGELVGDLGPLASAAPEHRRARCRFRRSASASPHRRRRPRRRSPSMVTMRATRLVPCPEAATTMSSPAATRPEATRAGKAAEIEVRTVDPLHRKAERRRAPCPARHRRSPDARAATDRRTRASLRDRAMTLSP